MTQSLPWLTAQPIARVRKELFRQHTQPGAAAVVTQMYVGPALERIEIHAVEASVDMHTQLMRRFSRDNGRTWSTFEPVEPFAAHYAGHEFVEIGGAKFFDPVSGVLVEAWLRQIGLGIRADAQQILDYPAGIMTRQFSTVERFYPTTYTRISRDFGKTWSTPQQLRYEDGDAFNPADPLNERFLQRNLAYFGSNFIRHRNGTLIHAVCSANSPSDPLNQSRYCRMGILCFIGQWDAARGDYAWTPGQRIEVPPSLSYEGLQEPSIAELRDGRLLIVWRAAADGYTIGRKWCSLSSDGGRTLDGIREWEFDDKTGFYSPASMHQLLRHQGTGKLFWIGNISRVPPRGNWPRYPLVIAEVDEEKAALKRNTVTLIDDRLPHQGEYVEFSNFWALENRETHHIEITLTAYGEDPAQVNNANCYRYVLEIQ